MTASVPLLKDEHSSKDQTVSLICKGDVTEVFFNSRCANAECGSQSAWCFRQLSAKLS
jgi:hypothetical protein